MRVSVIQMNIVLGDPEVNREQASKLIQKAAEDKPDVIVLPEMWNTAYSLDILERVADRDGQPSGDLISALSRETGINVVAGSVSDLREGKAYNTAYVFDRLGRRVADYSKVHLFRLMDEEKYLAPGDKPSTFELDGVRCGLIICYDLRFPELTRTLALDGARILFVPAEWPQPRLSHWRILNQARAIENQMFVVSCNRVGAKGDTIFFGHSMIIDPWGEIVSEGGEDGAIISAELDLDLVEKARARIPVFSDRAPGVYKL